MESDRDKFAKENFNLIYKFLAVNNLNSKRDEILDVLFIGYTKALNMYDPSKGSFSTVAFICMQQMYWNWCTASRYQVRNPGTTLVSLDAYVDDEESTTLLDMIPDDKVDVESEIYDKLIKESVDLVARDILNDKEYSVYIDYFKNGLDISQIARKIHISKQAVNLRKNNVIKKLLKYFKKDNVNYRVPEQKKEIMEKEIDTRSVEMILYDMVGE